MALKGKRFNDIDTIKENTMKNFNTNPKHGFKHVPNNGRTAGISAKLQKEPILKAIKCICKQ